jgi:catechol 2,3-dioxygenase-like lactoylglutathione lyase family enzyme
MNPHITVITLGVTDLEKSLRFYRDGLGFPTEGIVGEEFEYGAVVFIQLQPGLCLALWPRKSIVHDSGLVPLLSKQRMTLSGEATPATSRTRTVICGKWSGTRSGQTEQLNLALSVM